jgi:hypothetical protein
MRPTDGRKWQLIHPILSCQFLLPDGSMGQGNILKLSFGGKSQI